MAGRTLPTSDLRATVAQAHAALTGWLLVLLCLAGLWASPAHAEEPVPGMGLGLFASDPNWDYGPLVDEIATVGVDGVLLVVPWYQHDVRSTLIRPKPGLSPSISTVRRTLEQVRDAGLRATLMPIVLLETQENPRQWRGVIAPERDGEPATKRWFASYRDFVLAHAVVAGQSGAERFIVGSELLSMEGERALWLDLIAGVRAVFAGPLAYSANWDQFDQVTFWDSLDAIGVNGYFRLAKDGAKPTEDELVQAWTQPLRDLEALQKAVGLPLLLTEVGYPSRTTAAAKPWCACAAEEMDFALQATLYEALLRVFVGRHLARSGEAPLPFDAWFLWNWFGLGGPEDGTFTPRGKPAEDVLRRGLRRR
ncbi:MAG: hypothetical protein KDA24_16295 [Deltaproteobacteria bacterium]|nr:hypothetical protein [Deltaproteobacteria bacterium]